VIDIISQLPIHGGFTRVREGGIYVDDDDDGGDNRDDNNDTSLI
jgi:hypothetical protein